MFGSYDENKILKLPEMELPTNKLKIMKRVAAVDDILSSDPISWCLLGFQNLFQTQNVERDPHNSI